MATPQQFARAHGLEDPGPPAPHETPCGSCGLVAGHHSASCKHSGTERYGQLAPHFKTQSDVERVAPAPVAEPAPLEPAVEMIAEAQAPEENAAPARKGRNK